MRGKFSALMAMAAMSIISEQPVYSVSRKAGYKGTFVPKLPPKPENLRYWTCYGYLATATTKKAAAKRIMAQIKADDKALGLTLKSILNDIKQAGK